MVVSDESGRLLPEHATCTVQIKRWPLLAMLKPLSGGCVYMCVIWATVCLLAPAVPCMCVALTLTVTLTLTVCNWF
jgi:hypothetical protein